MKKKYTKYFITLGFLWSIASFGFTLQSQNLTFKELVTLMLEQTGKNYLLPPDLPDHFVKVNFKEINLLEGLTWLLNSENFQLKINKSEIRIFAPGKHQMETKIFPLKYAISEQMATLIKQIQLLSPQGKLAPESERNLIIVRDFPENLLEIGQQIKKLDCVVKQVLIEAKIVSIDKNYTQQFGLALNIQEKLISSPNALIANLAKLNPQWLNHQLNLLEKTGRGQVISQPSLFTQNHQAASIETGTEVPYFGRNRHGDTNVTFKKAVLSLVVTPEITTENEVNLAIQINQDKAEEINHDLQTPIINTRKIKTQIRLKNEETIILGGIYEWQLQKHESSLPGLSQIPIVNWLVSDKNQSNEQRELLIFVTVKII